MKKSILSGFYFAIALSLNAQSIEVGFKPKDSALVIDSIRATNLNTNQTVKLTGSETLTLVKTSTTGIGDLPINSGQGQVYPNPCDGNATVCFSIQNSKKVNVQVFNASGQLVSNREQMLEEGQHLFSLQLPSQGIYYIAVQNGDEALNYKVVSMAKGVQSASISYTGNEQVSSSSTKSNLLKSATTGKTLSYADGNNIMYAVYSGKNATVTTEKAGTSKTIEVAFYPCADKDGRNYKTVTIGTQTWMAENLAYLPFTTPFNTVSPTEPCYYVYNYAAYGTLYNWPAALTACPAGWHLPSRPDWETLQGHLGWEFGGGKMKSITGWDIPNIGATNESGFTALPGGYFRDGAYNAARSHGHWWCSRELPPSEASGWFLNSSRSYLESYAAEKVAGFSVRCVKD